MKLVLDVLAVLFVFFAFTVSSNAQSNNSSNKQQNKSLEIKRKPPVAMNAVINCRESSGFAKLKVTFDKSAKVTNVDLFFSSGCESFDKGAIKAATKIKFNPAIENGEMITVVKTVVYEFSVDKRKN